MANNCYYMMRVKGARENVLKFIDIMACDYNYETNEFSAERHMSRVFEADDSDLDDFDDSNTTVTISGDCAWSVHSCMCSGEHTYYNDDKDNPNSRRTTLLLESKILELEIEVFSEETGCEFQEHYHYLNGEELINDCVKYYEFYYDGEFDDELGIDTNDYDITQEIVDKINEEYNTDFELDDYDGNCFRRGGFDWDFKF